MKRSYLLLFALFMLTSCHTNPFFTEWDTPYGIPPYDKIKTADYLPALKEGIKQHNSEIEAITSCTEAPTFQNTIEALELSGELTSKVVGVLFNVSETDRSDALDAVIEEALPLLTAHEADISFNKALYERVAAVYKADQSALTREQQMVLKYHYDNFESEGIGLPEQSQARLREINSALSTKSQQIGNNILAESNAFKEKFGFSVSEYSEKMATTSDRDLRQQYHKAYTMRGHNGNEFDNSALIKEVLELRLEKARILGYSNFAAYQLSDKMAKTPAAVDEFLAGIIKASTAKAREEVVDMQRLMDADSSVPAGSKIEPWDWWYYAEKVRASKYALNDEDFKSYFHMDSVRSGAFIAAEKLYGVKVEAIENVPSYSKGNVQTWKISNISDGSLVGIFTTDYLPRSSKRGGAWMNNVRNQYRDASGADVRPIIVNVGNMAEYMNVDHVQTVFHEFGHALHGLLSKCNYPSVSGTSVKRDFVETFSQINEHWAFEPELLALYAKNAQGEVIPAELVEKINASLKFNMGFVTTELCAASILDMKLHEIEDFTGFDIDAFEAKVAAECGLNPEIGFRYRTTYFNHIFSSGYSAGYYSYLWSEVLDRDLFSFFEASPRGVFDSELSTKFKQTFLEKGGSEEPMELFRQFAGREPENEAFLRGRGLK